MWRVSCLPPNYQHSPSLNRRPSPGSRREWVCEREGRCNSQVWRRVMRHTPEVSGASSPPLLYACACASPLETGPLPRACTLVSSWVQEGCVEGAAAAPVHGWRARMPGRIIPGGAVARRGRAARRSRAPRAPDPRGSACGRRTPPLTWTLPSRTLPLLHNPRSQRGHQTPCLFFGLFIPLGHFYCIISV